MAIVKLQTVLRGARDWQGGRLHTARNVAVQPNEDPDEPAADEPNLANNSCNVEE